MRTLAAPDANRVVVCMPWTGRRSHALDRAWIDGGLASGPALDRGLAVAWLALSDGPHGTCEQDDEDHGRARMVMEHSASEGDGALEGDGPRPATASADEIARFAAIADDWWDPDGKFAPLHRLNPIRVRYVRDRLAAHFAREPLAPRPLTGLSVLDVGCGGGLLSEPMARLGADVTGLDADEKGLAVADAHAREGGLAIHYRCASPEDLVREGRRAGFDAVTAMEVVEHVSDVPAFLTACGELVRPGGAVVLATLNRTLRSLALAKIGAEYVLRWLPPGTHDWRKFLKPSELAAGLRTAGLRLQDVRGMTYDPLSGTWTLSHDLLVNYVAFATRD